MGALERTLEQIFPQDAEYRQRAKERLDQLALPHWALGDLMDLAIDLAGMTRSMHPPVGRKAIVTMAGDHGVTIEGISKFPKEVTPQMVHNFVNGGAGINALARQAGAKVFVVDMGVAADLRELAEAGKIINKKVALGTDNIAAGPAMSPAMARRASNLGLMSPCSWPAIMILRHRRYGHRQHHAFHGHCRGLHGKSVDELTGTGNRPGRCPAAAQNQGHKEDTYGKQAGSERRTGHPGQGRRL